MKFTLSTKPFADALALGVVNANISKFYAKSCVAQLTATKNSLTVNLEAAFIVTELRLKGMSDVDEIASIFVDCALLKQLVSTFETSTITLEFTDGGLILHSGKSKFTLPKMVDADELSLNRPSDVSAESTTSEIKKADWKFIKDFQMYAISMAFIHPVYTKVWVGGNGDVIVGDMDNSLFTHSEKNNLGATCLLSDTIINLFNSLPESAKLTQIDRSYQIQAATDGFEMISEFTPQYESDEDVGSYNSDMILAMMTKPEDNFVEVSTAAINKFLSQADLLSSSNEDTIILGVADGQMYIKDANVDCKIEVKGETTPFQIDFKTSLLKSVISNYNDEKINLSYLEQDGTAVGIIVWTKDLCTVLAGVD